MPLVINTWSLVPVAQSASCAAAMPAFAAGQPFDEIMQLSGEAFVGALESLTLSIEAIVSRFIRGNPEGYCHIFKF